MKKVLPTVTVLLLSVLLMNNVQAKPALTTLNMVIGIPELIIISLFSGIVITILIVVFKKITHK